MINNFISFSLRYYLYLKKPIILVLTMLIKKTEKIFIVIEQDVLSYQILKKSLIEKIDNFLKISKKISKNKNNLLIYQK